ncbi:WhiB family transcriptional regulator [Thermoactinospora rubra]|uniref:WhiB family transcriptional regulator n=1 Tax=Thermoactinospora rubra TaxID=1088767 RepID=UPI000A10BD2B|nr:WhiB family transcriptional regulator [Thermoactinospora rubra]
MHSRDRYGAWGLDTPHADDWRELAACRDHPDPDLWFPAIGPGGPDTAQRERRAYAPARRVCRDCPVWRDCLDYALTRGERWGMYGGLTPRERKSTRLLKKAGVA